MGYSHGKGKGKMYNLIIRNGILIIIFRYYKSYILIYIFCMSHNVLIIFYIKAY